MKYYLCLTGDGEYSFNTAAGVFSSLDKLLQYCKLEYNDETIFIGKFDQHNNKLISNDTPFDSDQWIKLFVASEHSGYYQLIFMIEEIELDTIFNEGF